MNEQRQAHVALNAYVSEHQAVFVRYGELLRAFYEKAAPETGSVCVMSGERVLFFADRNGIPR